MQHKKRKQQKAIFLFTNNSNTVIANNTLAYKGAKYGK